MRPRRLDGLPEIRAMRRQMLECVAVWLCGCVAYCMWLLGAVTTKASLSMQVITKCQRLQPSTYVLLSTASHLFHN